MIPCLDIKAGDVLTDKNVPVYGNSIKLGFSEVV